MGPNRKPSFLKNICPECGGGSVIRNDKVLGFRAPKFTCPDCGAGLTTTPTPRALWAFVVAAGGIPAAFWLAHWVQESFHLHPTVLAGIYGGLIGGVSSYSFKLVFEGLAFKPWRPGGF